MQSRDYMTDPRLQAGSRPSAMMARTPPGIRRLQSTHLFLSYIRNNAHISYTAL